MFKKVSRGVGYIRPKRLHVSKPNIGGSSVAQQNIAPDKTFQVHLA
jgi:hypothetical protein